MRWSLHRLVNASVLLCVGRVRPSAPSANKMYIIYDVRECATPHCALYTVTCAGGLDAPQTTLSAQVLDLKRKSEDPLAEVEQLFFNGDWSCAGALSRTVHEQVRAWPRRQ